MEEVGKDYYVNCLSILNSKTVSMSRNKHQFTALCRVAQQGNYDIHTAYTAELNILTGLSICMVLKRKSGLTCEL